MEAKIKLFDADGTQIGETFARRARQLVKQQRAVWVDDDHSAIRFNPDPVEDDWNEETEQDKPQHLTAKRHMELDPLYIFAKKKLKERRRITVHLALLIPEMILAGLFSAFIYDAGADIFALLFIGFSYGVLITANACNVFYYYDKFVKHKPSSTGAFAYWQKRQEAQLAAEVEKLRRMGYDK